MRNKAEDVVGWAIERVEAGKYDFKNCATALGSFDKGPYYVEDVVAAIVQTGGVFSEMASLLRRPRSGVRRFVMENPDVKEVWDNLRESTLDKIEKLHIDLALEGDAKAQQFMLRTLGKDRGYTTRVDNTSSDGTMSPIRTMNYDELMEEAKKRGLLP